MNSNEIRSAFLRFFESKKHQIVPSSPIVNKDDPTLMFTNAGMNPFKDIFLGNVEKKSPRIADTQKCLRVSGKHNDLEEVGVDTYHHTMFEMLGNWSFGDYYKEEAIAWAWELLTEVYGIPIEDLYVSYFEGDQQHGLDEDVEAREIWKKYVNEDRILKGSKKDNFWEMGETGPCGPCSEIHVDLRSHGDKKKVPGKELVNQDHPEVIEVWNLVFMELNRMASGELVPLPEKHIDTGMGFERLVRIIQRKNSNYDTDVFEPLLKKIETLSGKKYSATSNKQDIAFRVIADHIRAITFTIADGQLPANSGPGYVIRRILRRAIRYGYQFLKLREPFLYQMVDTLVEQMNPVFSNLQSQAGLIKNVLLEEETGFLRTIEQGIKRIDQYISSGPDSIDGKFAFELYDTYGFPYDLTALIAREFELKINKAEFDSYLDDQKNRSREAANVSTGDWVHLIEDDVEEFIGYDYTDGKVKITRYREVLEKNKKSYHLVFNLTPFYAESGGQVGDTGLLIYGDKRIKIRDTRKENNVIIHIADELPEEPRLTFNALVDTHARQATASNHSVTHLLHAALRNILGNHVEQKGSYVGPSHLRFDFSHYAKLSEEEVFLIEKEVNSKIRENIELEEMRNIPMRRAREMGAMALFGEKYGDVVRVIKFGDSIELCGGTHVPRTGSIGRFKILSESAIASGIRRIEAVSAEKADELIDKAYQDYEKIRKSLKGKGNLAPLVQRLQEENQLLKKEIEQLSKLKVQMVKKEFQSIIHTTDRGKVLIAKSSLNPAGTKDIAFQLKDEFPDLLLVLVTATDQKPGITVALGKERIENEQLNAGNIVRELAKLIQGGGGGQPFFAQAGGKDISGLEKVLEQARETWGD